MMKYHVYGAGVLTDLYRSTRPCLTKFPLDCEIGARLANKVVAVEVVLPSMILVSSRSK
jgi:hypothetical protein